MPCLVWKARMALQSAAYCFPSAVRPRNFSTFFWYGPAFAVQLAAWAGAAVSASVSGATSAVTASAMAPRLRVSPMAGHAFRVEAVRWAEGRLRAIPAC
ncbi:hypothetical protein STENM223S_03607 [Streptomyces tendae]